MEDHVKQIKKLLQVEISQPTVSSDETIWRIPRTFVEHRDFGPAVISKNGRLEWYFHGKKHRESGPAVFHPDGIEEYWIMGEKHREDGPAVLWYGKKEWWFKGKKHRSDGPAVEAWDGYKEYWINGIKLKEVDFKKIFNEKTK